MIKRLEYMKESLMNCVQGQLGDLASADAEELGAAIDMIKDLSEAVYYCTIVESMSENGKEKGKEKEKETVMYYPMYMPMEYAEGRGGQGQGQGGGRRGYRDMDYNMGRMYYEDPMSYAQGGGSGGGGSGSGSGSGGGGNSGGGGGSRGYQDGNRQSSGESRNYPYREYPIELRDQKEGQSPLTRKTYMERKMHGGDKAAQMQELDKYMQELSRDLTEMIEDASPEEKQMMQKKLSTLATKIV